MLNTQKISTQVRIRPGETSNSFGVIGSVYIQVVIDRVPDRIPVKIVWPVDYFDPDRERLKPRYDGDEECYQNNLVVAEEKAKANRLSLELYVSRTEITAKEFKIRYNSFASRNDFVQYIIKKREELYRTGIISEGTFKKYLTIVHRMQAFLFANQTKATRPDCWKFHLINLTTMQMFEAWLMAKEQKLGHNTMTGTMKILHKFKDCALADGISFNDPFKGYKMPKFSAGVREALDLDELKALKNFYLQESFTDHEKDVLERYLFACFTGLRKSDIEHFDTRIHLKGNRLHLIMFKTRKYNKAVEFKLSSFAMEIIGKRRGRIWPEMESALLNKTLRKLIDRLNLEFIDQNLPAAIDKYIKFHSGRDTFATNFLRLGGMLVVLKDILGHSSISMTEIYIKMAFDESDETIDAFDTI